MVGRLTPVDYAAPQSFRRSGDTLIAELERKRGEPGRFAGVLALGDGRGLEFSAVPGEPGTRNSAPGTSDQDSGNRTEPSSSAEAGFLPCGSAVHA